LLFWLTALALLLLLLASAAFAAGTMEVSMACLSTAAASADVNGV
jgi:hypothetical protein